MSKGKFVSMLLISTMLIVGCTGNPAKAGPKQEKTIPNNVLQQRPETGLPWETDPQFLKVINENNTNVLMASFKATLPDPILYERDNIKLAAEYLQGAVVQPGQVFSLNRRIGWRSADRGFKPGPMYSGGRIVSTVGGGVCKIASVMYNVCILANQEIIERHAHSMTVPYVPPGQDATISFGTKDFKFKNITNSPIVIWSKNEGGTLYIALYGKSKAPEVKWKHKVLRESDTWTEYIWDSSLPKGEKKLVYHGSKGITVHSWLVITTPDGKETIKDLGISAYRPCPEIVAKGSKVVNTPSNERR